MRGFTDLIVFIIFVAVSVIYSLFSPNSRRYDYARVNTRGGNYFQRRRERLRALNNAKDFLKPYKNIFGDLCLSNKYCIISISKSKKNISCFEKTSDNDGFQKCFIAKDFQIFDINSYFNVICTNFSHGTKYENLLFSCNQVATVQTSNIKSYKPKIELKKDILGNTTSQNIIDLNNSSEAELTALPGISTIIAKKIVKFRENTRAFRSVEDFFTEFKTKPHFKKQLEKLVCVTPVKRQHIAFNKNERILDI